MSRHIFFNLLILSLIALSLSKDCSAMVYNGNCEFYTQCLEEKYSCGPHGYPVGYGYKYCSKFLKFFEEFPATGKKWVEKTLICLKDALYPLYDARSNCDVIYAVAFASHPECYFQAGFCDLFIDSANIFKTLQALLKVYEVKDFMSVTSMKQVFETAKMCGSDYTAKVNQAFKDIFFPKFLELEN